MATRPIIALDTNVIVALWNGDEVTSDFLSDVLDEANARGLLVIAPAVYAELLANPRHDAALAAAFLGDTNIRVDWQIDEELWHAAGLAYREYGARRRSQRGDPGPRRILTDFIIGAHASRRASELMTFDEHIYRQAFPSLKIVTPQP